MSSAAPSSLPLWEPRRPRTRAECHPLRTHPETGELVPCPWASCKHSLLVDVNPQTGDVDDRSESGAIETCSLDVADREGATLEEVGQAFGVTRERIRQIESKAIRVLGRRIHALGLTAEFRHLFERFLSTKPRPENDTEDDEDSDDDGLEAAE